MNGGSMKDNELHLLFHKLWTKAVGTQDYNKLEWLKLEAEILRLERIEGRWLDAS